MLAYIHADYIICYLILKSFELLCTNEVFQIEGWANSFLNSAWVCIDIFCSIKLLTLQKFYLEYKTVARQSRLLYASLCGTGLTNTLRRLLPPDSICRYNKTCSIWDDCKPSKSPACCKLVSVTAWNKMFILYLSLPFFGTIYYKRLRSKDENF
jgi:hypothetical protein